MKCSIGIMQLANAIADEWYTNHPEHGISISWLNSKFWSLSQHTNKLQNQSFPSVLKQSYLNKRNFVFFMLDILFIYLLKSTNFFIFSISFVAISFPASTFCAVKLSDSLAGLFFYQVNESIQTTDFNLR